jgi:hypothetical protein
MASITELIVAMLVWLFNALFIWLFDIVYPDDVCPKIPNPSPILSPNPPDYVKHFHPTLTSTPKTQNLGRSYNNRVSQDFGNGRTSTPKTRNLGRRYNNRVSQDFGVEFSPVLRIQDTSGARNLKNAYSPISEYRKNFPMVRYLQRCKTEKAPYYVPYKCNNVKTRAARLRI